MSTASAKCPRCRGDAILDAEKYDIGSDVRTVMRRVACKDCGDFSFCDGCGGIVLRRDNNGDITEFRPHETWCREMCT